MIRRVAAARVVALIGALAGPAAAEDRPEPATPVAHRWARWHVGTETRWWQQALGVRRFAERPAQVPRRDASMVEVGERFWARASSVYLVAGTAAGSERFQASMGARVGLAVLDLREESRADSVINPSSPPSAVTATGSPDAAFGLDARAAVRFDDAWPWLASTLVLDGFRLSFDDAPLFGGPPLAGTAVALRVAAALTADWAIGRWHVFAGARLAFTSLQVEWSVSVGPPTAVGEQEVTFWERWPARAVGGLGYADERIRAHLELAIGRWPPDLGLALRVAIDV